MDWPDDPATEHQLNQLRGFGFVVTRPLTLTEAARLIRQYHRNPLRPPSLPEPASKPAGPTRSAAPVAAASTVTVTQSAVQDGISESTRMQAYHLHTAVERATQSVRADPNGPNVRADLVGSVNRRQQFWTDTCRDVREMHVPSVQVCELYQNYGCRFVAPTAAQAQDVLEALDGAMPLWDRDHPDLFYQTLELNFPQLVRRG